MKLNFLKFMLNSTPNGIEDMMLDLSFLSGPLSTLLLINLHQSSSDVNISQQSFMLDASFNFVIDLRPRPRSAKGLQHLCQATVTIFLLFMSPDQMKFLIQPSICLIIEAGQL